MGAQRDRSTGAQAPSPGPGSRAAKSRESGALACGTSVAKGCVQIVQEPLMNAPNTDRALPLIFAAVGLALPSGCTRVCTDDGFAWQQDPSCLAGLPASSTSSDTDATSELTGPA